MASNEQRGKEALSNLEKELAARDRKQKTRPWVTALASVAVIGVLGGGIYYFATQDGGEDLAAEETTATETTAETATEEPNYEPIATERAVALPPTVSCAYNEAGDNANFVGLPPQEDVSTEGTVTIDLETSAGPIGMELDRSVSPCTVNAIEYLAAEGYYNDTVCHRLTTSEGLKVLQCGDPTGTGAGGPGFQFANEFPTDEALENVDLSALGLPEDLSEEEKQGYASQLLEFEKYERGTIAMANSGIDTNGSQFFLNYGDGFLTPTYTYFGQIDEAGLATLDAIAEKGVKEDPSIGGPSNDGEPVEEVRITTATVR
ncbi:Putative bifunctional phosphatase/peptidyl-prolyl cis-trans isomerase [Corynebacterium glaucum]|uniref:Putative bifunctional phosphatase/peptidyl-prolyl cis-trans isomerase n=1 Tax=Corynebacterium glaucum TaxID=187491 RepID=A0A1Q2HX61_9CORY|nr:peptidylprolyl isomerase [Corynebacterium glaucum]AQQ15360.1 Putative bifunctional phosphatase/peptidyl-prolyl cis-trans isomerase [Corynebacterium glaucum]